MEYEAVALPPRTFDGKFELYVPGDRACRPVAGPNCSASVLSEQVPPPVSTDLNPVPLEWVPPALLDLQAQAAVKSSFTLDRAMLGVAADVMNDRDPEVRQSINKLDGVSVHLLRFGANRIADPARWTPCAMPTICAGGSTW